MNAYKVLAVFISLTFSVLAANAGDNFIDLTKAQRKSVVKAVNAYMVPYSKALARAHVRVVGLLAKCVQDDANLHAYPADLLVYGDEGICLDDAKLLIKFNKVWEDTNPDLPDNEYTRYRDYQTLAELGHEAHAAYLMASWSTSMLKYKDYKFKEFGKMIGEFRQDYDGYTNADLSERYFTRGDGCFLELLVGTGDNRSKGAHIMETCD